MIYRTWILTARSGCEGEKQCILAIWDAFQPGMGIYTVTLYVHRRPQFGNCTNDDLAIVEVPIFCRLGGPQCKKYIYASNCQFQTHIYMSWIS